VPNATRLGPQRAWTSSGGRPFEYEVSLETMAPWQLEQLEKAHKQILDKICAVRQDLSKSTAKIESAMRGDA
jgi:hypothetical protein